MMEEVEPGRGFLGGAIGKEPACWCWRHRVTGSIPGSGRSPRGGHGNPLQYSCLGNPMDRGAWWATVHSITKSWRWLNNMHACWNDCVFFFQFQKKISKIFFCWYGVPYWWFAYVEPSLRPWGESSLIMVYEKGFCICFSNILLKIFAFILIKDIGL